MSKITFINHSSVLTEDNGTKILCDPWFKGTAFQDGWSLLHENSHNINEIDFNYIWISHEHPDHFSIATLLDINKPTTFLYQETKDKKVKNFLEKKGHMVIELKDSCPTIIDDTEVTLFISDGYDSALLFRFSDGKTFLNVNDARIDLDNGIERVKSIFRDQIDLIGVQYSYASWAGNSDDDKTPNILQNHADKKNTLIFQKLRPKSLMIFANFVYFSHEENFYWNKRNWLPHVVEKLAFEDCKLIVPLPDQEIELEGIENAHFDESNSKALNFWEEKISMIEIKTHIKPPRKINEIISQYNEFFDGLWKENDIELIKNKFNKNFNLNILVSDLNISIKIFLFEKKITVNDSKEEFDCKLSSETLIFLLKNKFARGTVTINSRIEFNYENAHKLFIFFYIFYKNNIGVYVKNNFEALKELKSIQNTAVMSSIFGINKKAFSNFEKDLELFN